MINRWFHRPRLHSAIDGEVRRVGWLELFYDLVYVAAIIQLGNALSGHVDLYGFLAFVGVFTPMWLAWTDFTFYNNRFVVDDLLHRALAFAQMFGVGAMAVAADHVLDGEVGAFLVALAVVKSVFAAMALRAWLQNPEVRAVGGAYTANHVATALAWCLAALLPAPWNALVAVGAVAIDVSGKLFADRMDELLARHPPDVLHLSERYGLLTLIVLGESFVKGIDAIADKGASATTVGMGVLVLGITFSLWWIYFDDVAGSRIRRTRLAGYTWVWAHLPLTLAITAVGVAIKKAMFFDPSLPAPEAYRGLLAVGLGLALASVGAIDAVTERRQAEMGDRTRVWLRVGSAGLVALVAAIGGSMSALTFCALLSGICVLQVLADLSMAPLSDPEAAHHEAHALWEAADRAGPVVDPAATFVDRPVLSASSAVRKGVPNAFRKDLYSYLIDGSWLRLFATLAAAWILSNVFFGALYLLEPGSVSNVHDDDFLEAFSFSIQTMSSIGYGVMAPRTDYAHVLVAIESMVGLLGIALATGLVFAKASRPSLAVLFSRHAVIHLRDGRPTLEFRVGNARGSEVAEATIHVSALLSEETLEGHRMRRLHDLELHRKMTPMFVLTWSVMHTLDERSPLHGITKENAKERFVSIVCTLTGHDATYGQTTYARHLYRWQDLRFDHDFVDVVETLPDGRLQIDFGRFHDTRPAGG